MLEGIVRKNFREFDKNDKISKIFGYLYEGGDFPIIMDDKKAWGIIDNRRLLKSKLSGKERIKDFVVGVPKVDATYSIEKVISKMKKSGVDTIIVTHNKDLIGYLTSLDIAKKVGIKKNAESLMRFVEPVNGNDEIGDVFNLMKKRGEDILPVLSGENFSGIIGIKNILKLLTTHNKITDYHQEKISLMASRVRGFMEYGIKTCNPEDGRDKIIEIMEEQKFVIVCKNRKYMGVIKMVDLLKGL
ncbi:MAG TPA: CBS domain-containing protein [Thermoplasmatales archaeon]|nr:CBS domain-containing protein [Thermoplasmatales archaeon]